MLYILLFLTVILAGFRSVLSKVGNRYIKQKNDILVFNFFLFFASWIIIALRYAVSGVFAISFYTASMAVLYAFFTLMSQLMFMKATDNGDAALSSLVYSCGFIFPAIFGILMYNEELTILKITGILSILLSFAVSTVSKSKAMSRKWFIYSFSAMLSSGMVGIFQKMLRMSGYAEQQNGFLLIAFSVIVIAVFVIMPKKKGEKYDKAFFLTAFSIGICFGAVNIINTYLSGAMPGIIAFPVINGGGIISSGILAYLILKERLTLRKWTGILIGLTGIILIAV